MDIKNAKDKVDFFCDWGIIYSLCALIFVLSVSIALIDSFAALAVFFYLIKKINRIVINWPLKTLHLNLIGKARFFWDGCAPPTNFLNRPLQFLSAAIFISVVFSQYPALSLYAFMGKFVKVVFLYFSFIEAFDKEEHVWIFLKIFLVAAFITALSGFVQHYTGCDFLKGHHIGTENSVSTHRINSTFFGANGFGAYLLPVFALVAQIFYTLFTRRKFGVLLGALGLFLVLLLACLCWTYSRSSWLGYLIILFGMVLLDRRKILYAGILLLIFIFIFMPSLSTVRHQGLINDRVGEASKEVTMQAVLEQGGSGRMAYWMKAISIIRSSPVWGTGLNTYTRIVRRDPDPVAWHYAHNCYLQLAAETGLLGLACFLWMLFVLLKQIIHYFKSHKPIDSWPLTFLQGAITGLVGLLVQGFFDNTFYTVQLGVLLWLMIGLAVALTRLNLNFKENV